MVSNPSNSSHSASAFLTVKRVEELLARIQTAPSMLFDEGFRFVVSPLGGAGFIVQFRYNRRDTHTGRMGEGESRSEYVSSRATEEAVLMTGYVLMKSIVEHELLECFLVDGIRLFDPHQTISQLQAGKTPLAGMVSA